MPFTQYHLGPALGLGLPLRKYMHLPTFILANVIVDVEPFLVFVYGLRYPLHGYLHTFFLAFFVGLVIGYTMFLLERLLHPIYKVFLLEPDDRLRLRSFMVAGVLGTMLHILLDSPLYDDIHPFYPLTINPLYNPTLSAEVYGICVWMGIFGVVYYAGLLAFSAYKRLPRKLHLTKRGLVIVSFSIICIASIIGGFLYWHSQQLAEQRLQDYVKRLEDLGYTTEEHSLDFHVNNVVTVHFFGDFLAYSQQEGIDHVYFDRNVHALYFLQSSTDGVVTIIFYYSDVWY
jgi:hypothetical protein